MSDQKAEISEKQKRAATRQNESLIFKLKQRAKVALKIAQRRNLPITLPGSDPGAYCCIEQPARAAIGEHLKIAFIDAIPVGSCSAVLPIGCSNCLTRDSLQLAANINLGKDLATKRTILDLKRASVCTVSLRKLILLPIAIDFLKKKCPGGTVKIVTTNAGNIIAGRRATETLRAPQLPRRRNAEPPPPERIIPEHIRLLFHRPDNTERPR